MRDQKTFKDTLAAANIDLGSLVLRDDGTVATDASVVSEHDTAPGQMADLPPLQLSEGTGDLELREVIGEGGMGIVHVAHQASLMRHVAVKQLRPEFASPRRVAAFVREARVTGALEHPNIVPIHGLGAASDGGPLIVMKRVVGRSWSSYLEQTEGKSDFLEIHLPILESVCRAVEAAHAKGVLHRDLKPENVLVGDFGEVLVVDWGLAVAVGEPPVEGMPTIAEVTQVVGTPRYMAPEMASGDSASLGPATDVYLLGATLHEVLTGLPRHDGPTLMAILYDAYASEPYDYGPDVDPELASIANRACRPSPDDRFESVVAFRQALADYREHAVSRALAAEARRQLADEEPDWARARFGFEQALAAWPENEVARTGLLETLEGTIDRALRKHQLQVAQTRIEELVQLAGRSPEMEARLESLRVRIEQESARVARLEHAAREQDLGAAASARKVYGMVFAFLFGSYNVSLGLLDHFDAWHADHVVYSAGAFGVAAVIGLFALFQFRTLVPNRASLRLMRGLAVILAAQVPVFVALGYLGIDVYRALAVSLFQLGGSFLLLTFSFDTGNPVVGLFTLAVGGVALTWPSIAFFAVALAYAVFFVTGALLRFEFTDGAGPAGPTDSVPPHSMRPPP